MRQMKGKRRSPRKGSAGSGSFRARRGVRAFFFPFSSVPARAGTSGKSRKAAPSPGRIRILWNRIVAGERLLPAGAGVGACAALYAITGIYGAALNGSVARMTQGPAAAVSQGVWSLGNLVPLRIANIEISGETRGRRDEVAAALGVKAGDSIVFLNAREARRRVEEIAWVKQAEVLRLLPDSIKVKVTERPPFAVWQWQGDLSVIDAEGVVIGPASQDDYAALPLVVGTGANKEAAALFELLARWPALRPRMRAAVRVADRRWNIRLFNGVDIRLPEVGVAAALDELAALEESYGLLQRDIAAVDLRLSDRITIRLSHPAAEQRRAAQGKAKAKRAETET